MAFLEMTSEETHGGGSWAFSKCVWVPVVKRDGTQSRFWNKILQIEKGNAVFHLLGKSPNREFVGYSVATTEGYITEQRPPKPGTWGYAPKFYRADLSDFIEFAVPIKLTEIFATRREKLSKYMEANKALGAEKLNLFYLEQKGVLRCTNGAYLSDMSEELIDILFGKIIDHSGHDQNSTANMVKTSVQIKAVKTRVGQTEFSDKIKGKFNSQCCFPDCNISDPRFLVGSHIARWADNEDLRGNLGNGLCLCLLHDKAFEIGLFTLNDNFEVIADPALEKSKSNIAFDILRQNGQSISMWKSPPLLAAVKEHRQRIFEKGILHR